MESSVVDLVSFYFLSRPKGPDAVVVGATDEFLHSPVNHHGVVDHLIRRPAMNTAKRTRVLPAESAQMLEQVKAEVVGVFSGPTLHREHATETALKEARLLRCDGI